TPLIAFSSFVFIISVEYLVIGKAGSSDNWIYRTLTNGSINRRKFHLGTYVVDNGINSHYLFLRRRKDQILNSFLAVFFQSIEKQRKVFIERRLGLHFQLKGGFGFKNKLLPKLHYIDRLTQI